MSAVGFCFVLTEAGDQTQGFIHVSVTGEHPKLIFTFYFTYLLTLGMCVCVWGVLVFLFLNRALLCSQPRLTMSS